MSVSARHSRQRPTRMVVWLRRLGFAALGMGLLLAALYAGLQTTPAKQALVAYLNRRLNQSSYQVRIAGLSGRLPQRPCIRSITCADAQGPWLRIEGARLVWSPLQWFTGQLTLDTLAAAQVTVLRRPTMTHDTSAPSRWAEVLSWIPQVELAQLALKRVELDPALLGRPYRMSLAGKANLASQGEDLEAVLHLTGDLTAELALHWQRHGPAFDGGAVALEVTYGQHRATGNTTYALADATLGLRDLQVSLPGISVQGDLSVQRKTRLSRGTARIDIQDAAYLSTLCRYPLQGQGAIELQLDHAQGMQHASVTWDLNNLERATLQAEALTGSAELTDLYHQIGGMINLSLKNVVAQSQTIEQLTLEAQGRWQQGTLSAHGTGRYGEPFAFSGRTQWRHRDTAWDLTLESTDITYGTHRMALTQPAALTIPTATFRAGPYRLQNWHVTAEGHEVKLAQGIVTWSAPVLHVTGNAQFYDNVPTEVNADISLPLQAHQGKATVCLVRHGVPLESQIAYTLGPSRIAVSELTCALPGADLTGQGVFHTDTHLGQGAIQVQAADLAPLGTFLGQQVQGAMHGRLALDIQDDIQGLQATCEGKNLAWKQAKLEHMALHATGDPSKIRLTTTVQGTLQQPFIVDVNTLLNMDNADEVLRLDQATLQYGSQRLTLKHPAVLQRQPGPDDGRLRYGLQDWVWQANGAEVSLDGWGNAWQVSLQATMQELDISALPLPQTADLAGKINAQIHLTGSLDRPQIQVNAHLRDLGPQPTGRAEVTRLNTDLKATLTRETLNAELVVSTPANDRAQLTMQLPVVFGLRPWHWTPQMQSLRLHGMADADVGILDWLPVLREATLQGRIKADLVCTGDIASGAGSLSGQAQWVDGLYEDIQLGTVVQHINARLRAQDQVLILEQVTASANQEGRMTAQGRIKLSTAEDLPYQIQIKTERFPWVQRADATIVASGEVNLSGSIKAMTVKGQLRIDRGLVDLAALPPPPPPTLLAYGATRPGPDNPVSPVQPQLTVQGNLRIDLGGGGDFRVIGTGLDSLWQGHLDLIKADEHWKVTGALSPYRGDFRMLGRPFRLSEGTIRLDGVHPVVPILDLTAVHRRRGIEARVHMSGRMTDPIIRIDANPPMPEDAILATVLFGKDLATISPFQALQLAAVVRNLHSPNAGGMNLFQRTRQTLGVDSIDVRSQDERSDQMAVAVGKYLNPDVYVEVQQPLNNDGLASTRIEYEVRPNLTIETEAGPGIRPGLGVNWKKDY